MNQSTDCTFPANPNIVYMGTPDFAVPALKSLVENGFNISAVITQPDRPKGRGRSVSFSPVKDTALEYNLEVLQPEDVNDSEFIETMRNLNPDLFIVAAFGQILHKTVLEIPRFGAVNIHASLLPKYRGAAPIQRAILDNEPVTGITLMKMARGLDKGPILLKEEVPIKEYETTGQLFDRLADFSGDVAVKFLKESAGKELKAEPQDDSLASYASKITKEMAEIDWSENAVKISSLIRAMDPFPGATTILENKKIKLFSPEIADFESVSDKPGKIIIKDKNRFMVETGKGVIELNEIQLPGKKRIQTADFLRGYKISPDTFLEY